MSLDRQLSIGGLMVALAAIDFVGALVAQDFADRRRVCALLVGCGLQIVLFVVYAVALRLATLTIVTLGWIVLLQVAVVATDVARGSLRLGWAQWAAVAVVLIAQCYLVVSTEGQDQHQGATGSGAAAADPYPVGQTSAGRGSPGRSPVTRNTTRRATDTAWSANRS
jgi:drug/metabolite transporter (DMT)-like permease